MVASLYSEHELQRIAVTEVNTNLRCLQMVINKKKAANYENDKEYSKNKIAGGTTMNHEEQRLQEVRDKKTPWKKWGPYLSERQWGTVREDYSENGDAWNFFTHEQARSRAYRWGEDGIAGISDDKQHLCFASPSGTAEIQS